MSLLNRLLGLGAKTWRFVTDTRQLQSLDARIKQRLERREGRRWNWDFFLCNAEGMFRSIADQDPRIQEFDRLYRFQVFPNNRYGRDRRMVEVMFGSKPFDRETHYEPLQSSTHEVIVEMGAILRYYRQDNDSVVVFLHPPVTRGEAKRQRFYVIDVIRDSSSLTGSGALKRHLNYLRAMMEVHSIDGCGRWLDWLRVLCVERVRTRINPPIEGDTVIGERPVEGWGRTIVEIVVLSGLSGWAVLVLQGLRHWMFGP